MILHGYWQGEEWHSWWNDGSSLISISSLVRSMISISLVDFMESDIIRKISRIKFFFIEMIFLDLLLLMRSVWQLDWSRDKEIDFQRNFLRQDEDSKTMNEMKHEREKERKGMNKICTKIVWLHCCSERKDKTKTKGKGKRIIDSMSRIQTRIGEDVYYSVISNVYEHCLYFG